MAPECIYGLHFLKIFRGGYPRTPLGRLHAFGTRHRATLPHGTRDPTRRFCLKKLPVFHIFHIFYSNHTVVPFFFVKRGCLKNAIFFGLRGAKNAIFWYAGCEKSGRVGNPVKELEIKSSLSLY